MKVKIEALDAFTHGRLNAVRKGLYTISSGDAKALEKVGLVKIVEDADDSAEDDSAPAPKGKPITHERVASAEDESVDDLVGGAKKEAEPKNKAMPAPDNKAAHQKK